MKSILMIMSSLAKTLLLLLLPVAAFAGDNTWLLLNSKCSAIPSFPSQLEVPGRKVLYLPIQFNSAQWQETNESIPRGAVVESVTLVSSAYAENTSFNQDALDRSRLNALQQRFPSLLNDSRTQWARVRETGAANAQEARKLFHGFVLVCREAPDKASMAKEIASLTSMFSSSSLSSSSSSSAKKAEPKAADHLPSAEKTTEPKLIAVKGAVTGSEIMYTWSDTVFTKIDYGTAGVMPFAWPGVDTTVTAALNRNKQWKDMLVVCDVTGSMSPYTGQLLAWFQLHTKDDRVKSFVFFNDGDMKPDYSKVAGATGGLYSTVASGFDSVFSTAMFAMRQGFGGDAPENNVEALLYGIKNYGDAKEIVMIADNWATPRDLAYASSLNRPVRIIVCGGAYGINPAYLDLARKTGGSVHTMESDLTDLAKLHEGESIAVGPYIYTISNGKFVLTGHTTGTWDPRKK